MGSREQYYEDGYLRRWGLGPPSRAQLDEAVGFLSFGGVGRGALALDLGCGHGRYSIGLARAGAKVVALDASAALLRRAVPLAAEWGAGIQWVRGDMRILPFRGVFEFVLMVDAFGCFEGDDEGAAILEEVHRVLQGERALVMRNPNATPIRRQFRELDEERRAGVRTTIRRALGSEGRTITERIAVDDGTGVREFERQVRIYSYSELAAVLGAAGFVVQAHYATPTGEPFQDERSQRMITIARKAR